MLVVAKVNVTEIRQFGDVAAAQIQCVCDDRLMAIREGNIGENHLFNQASPWGSGQIALKGANLHQGEELYLIFTRGEGFIAPGALAGGAIRCHAITEFGGTTRHVEWSSSQRNSAKVTGCMEGEPLEGSPQLDRFNLKMQIDNPNASSQFEAGSDDGWLHIYRANDITLEHALADAHDGLMAVYG